MNKRVAAVTVAVIAILAGGSSAAAQDYPPGGSSLQIDAVRPVCVADAPYVQYAVLPIGFTFDGTATLTFTSPSSPGFSETVNVTSLRGQVLYPGASVDANGNPTDWPGWRFDEEEQLWVEDPSDAFLRTDLYVTIEVNPSATAKVEYPPSTASCADPENPRNSGGGGGGTPGQQLPSTGSDGSTPLRIGAVFTVAGLAAVIAAARRRRPSTS